MDLDPVTVRAVLEVGPDGQVTGRDWSGPPELVAAVAASLPGCADVAAGPMAWAFPEAPLTVVGVVRSRGDRAPVPLTLIVGDRLVRAGDDGRFAVRNLAPGPATVRLATTAWRLRDPVTIDVPSDQQLDLTVWVDPNRVGVDELVGSYRAAGSGLEGRLVDLDRARAIPGTLGDPLRALTHEPGVARTPFDGGWLLVRGGEPDETGQYLDGVQVPQVYHLGGFTTILHPEMVRAVRFWPGLFPARYGDAISGAVDLVPRSVGDRPRAVAGANLLFADAYVEVPTRFGGLAFAARRSYLDGLLALVVGPEGAAIAPRFWDGSARITVGPGSALVLGSSDAIDVPSFAGDGTLHLEQQALQLQGEVPLGAHLSVWPWLGWTHRTLTGELVDENRIDTLAPGIRVEAHAEPADDGRMLGGFEVQRSRFALTVGPVEAAAPVWTVDPYAGLTVGEPVQLWTEARFTAVLVEGDPLQPVRTAFTPRGGVRWRIRDGLDAHVELGRLAELPTPTLWLPIADGAYLGLERSDQLAGGGSWSRGPWSLGADLWRRATWDLSELELDGSVGEAIGRAYGLETHLALVRDAFEGSARYQYTRSEKQDDPDEPWLPSPFESPHQLELLAVGRLARAQTVSSRFLFTSGYPRLPGEAGLEPFEAYDLLRQQSVALDLPADRVRMAPFYRLDLRYARRWTFRRWQLDASLEVQNLTNRRVVEPIITGFGESRPSYGFGLPILPIFGLDGRWFPQPSER